MPYEKRTVIHTAVTGGRQLSDFNIIHILIVRYIRKTKLQIKLARCLTSVQWTTTVAANTTNSITVIRTLKFWGPIFKQS